MARVTIKNKNTTSLGDIFHVMDKFSSLKLEKSVNLSLGQREKTDMAFQTKFIR